MWTVHDAQYGPYLATEVGAWLMACVALAPIQRKYDGIHPPPRGRKRVIRQWDRRKYLQSLTKEFQIEGRPNCSSELKTIAVCAAIFLELAHRAPSGGSSASRCGD